LGHSSMAEIEAYRPRKVARSSFIEMRGLRCHVRTWGPETSGPETSPTVVLLHGSRDCGATFQFMIDAFSREYRFVAPDWRGYGRTDWNPQGYWFQDYLADLDIVLDAVAPGKPVALVGHSLGGQAAGIYAGVRPKRVSRLVALDAFGLVDSDPNEAPDTLATWIDIWRQGPETSRPYDTLAQMAERLQQTNRRLSADKALFLAAESSRARPDGKLEWSFDPMHRAPFAIGHRNSEWAACMKRIEAPTLWLASDRKSRIDSEPGGIAARAALLKNVVVEKVLDTSHNLHHDRPADVARIVEAFLSAS
jgi:pimeloyl-ACP methyl ester carboxylesterase